MQTLEVRVNADGVAKKLAWLHALLRSDHLRGTYERDLLGHSSLAVSLQH